MQNVSFCGLTNDLSKNILSKKEISRLVTCYPRSKGFVGNLPNEWIQNIPKEERNVNIPKIFEMFSSALNFEKKIPEIKKIAEAIKSGLIKYKAILPDAKVKFKALGVGGFAETYKLTVGENTYVVKIFDNLREDDCDGHGNYSEQNNALYLNAKENSDWVKFYFGSLNDKYMVTKFISSKDKRPDKKINLMKKGLVYVDYDVRNIKKKHNIDYGGFFMYSDFPVKCKPAIKVINQLSELPREKQDKVINDIKNSTQAKDYAEKMSGVEYILNHRNSQPNDKIGFLKKSFEYFSIFLMG